MTTIASNRPQGLLFLFLLVFTINSCSSDDSSPIIPDTEMAIDDSEEEIEEIPSDDSINTESDDDSSENEDNDESDNTDDEIDAVENTCSNPSDFIFNEKDGLVLAEFENGEFTGNWTLKSNGNNHTGDGYMVWEGPQFFNDPGHGIGTFKINIATPGTYRFIWYNAIKTGNDGTEHNDTWLRFNDANKFYGKKGNSIIYPNDSGKTPNPNGASKDGWFKIYRGGSDLDFKWYSRTSDNDAHEIYVKFNSPGTYLMEVSARSSGHAIDKFILFNSNWSKAEATSIIEQSIISCD